MQIYNCLLTLICMPPTPSLYNLAGARRIYSMLFSVQSCVKSLWKVRNAAVSLNHLLTEFIVSSIVIHLAHSLNLNESSYL